ncbi:MAG TPA: transposase [Propionibacteriaceae bacterium]|nr:transposase [Propionibacteriaceae bacterium]
MTAAVQVVGGVDPHADTVSVAVLTAVGKVIGDAEFATDADGYARAVEFLTSHGLVERVWVEGAASYGAGISWALTAAGISVVEVERPTRSARRRAGKSDRLDAYHAARAVLGRAFHSGQGSRDRRAAGTAPGSPIGGQGAHRNR